MKTHVYLPQKDALSVDPKEILRYMGVKNTADEIEGLALQMLGETVQASDIRICYLILPVTCTPDGVLLDGHIKLQSSDLARHLQGVARVALLGATLGIGADRLIAKYQHLSAARALAADAAASALIEAACDHFCAHLQSKEGQALTARFSPGYGDLPLHIQHTLFSLLDCPRSIGLTLTDSLMMTPIKSVSAIVGIGAALPSPCRLQCHACSLPKCLYRKDSTNEPSANHP